MYLVTESLLRKSGKYHCVRLEVARELGVSMSPRPIPPSAREHALQGAKAPAHRNVWA